VDARTPAFAKAEADAAVDAALAAAGGAAACVGLGVEAAGADDCDSASALELSRASLDDGAVIDESGLVSAVAAEDDGDEELELA
jgi:hypothetical protein